MPTSKTTFKKLGSSFSTTDEALTTLQADASASNIDKSSMAQIIESGKLTVEFEFDETAQLITRTSNWLTEQDKTDFMNNISVQSNKTALEAAGWTVTDI